MHNKIPRAATRKAVQRDTLKTLSITQNRILINVLKTTGRGFPGGAVVENLPANAGDTGSSPGPGRSHMPRSN